MFTCPMHPAVQQESPGACHLCGMALRESPSPTHPKTPAMPSISMAKSNRSTDPVCGMTVDPTRSAGSTVHAGVTYHFCSKGCLARFTANPAKFLDVNTPKTMEPEAATAAPAGLRAYAPLITVIALIALATLALAIRDARAGSFEVESALAHFMAGFFLVFAGFKLMDLRGFASGYATYDLLAGRVPAYAFVYPFVELSFGVLMLVGFHPDWLLVTEALVMAFSGVGVVVKLAKRQPFQCACLGTFLKVPLTKVTVVEDFGMAALAVAMLLL